MIQLRHHLRSQAFTLIEMLVVISIIVVLMGLAFPAFQSVQNSAKKTQAKNDLVQIVTAVNAYYTEYGKYPLPATTTSDSYPVGRNGSSGTSSKEVFDGLRGVNAALNPRQIAFINVPDAKDSASPRAGMGSATDGQFYDPWGGAYAISIDANYNNEIPNPYSAGAGSDPLRTGVIAWSFGKDKSSSTMPGPATNKTSGTEKDDVISWQ